MGLLSLSPEAAIRRCFKIEHEGRLLAMITPDHLFTRRSKIDIRSPEFDFPTIAFAFWLVALSWRRTQRHNS